MTGAAMGAVFVCHHALSRSTSPVGLDPAHQRLSAVRAVGFGDEVSRPYPKAVEAMSSRSGRWRRPLRQPRASIVTRRSRANRTGFIRSQRYLSKDHVRARFARADVHRWRARHRRAGPDPCYAPLRTERHRSMQRGGDPMVETRDRTRAGTNEQVEPVRMAGVEDPSATLVSIVPVGNDPAAGFGYRLRDAALPLRVSDADGDGVFVATDTFSTSYGAGASPEAAGRNYRANLFEYHEELEADAELLAPGLRREWAVLQQRIEPNR